MHIVCPHCTTSFAIKPATLGAAGRNVRCSRCKEIWLARPEDAVEVAPAVPAMAEASQPAAVADAAAEWEAMARQEEAQDAPVVESPSISADLPEGEGTPENGDTGWPTAARDDAEGHEGAVSTHASRLARIFRLASLPRLPAMPAFGLPTACGAMGALILALVIWRAEVVQIGRAHV